MFTLEQATKTQRGVEVELYSFFNLGARWTWVVNATSRGDLPPGKRPGTPRAGGWMGPRAGLD